MFQTLLNIKQAQKEALQQEEWDTLSNLEKQFHKVSFSLDMNPELITSQDIEQLKIINALHLEIFEEVLSKREASLNHLLELKKGKNAVNAYTSRT